MHQGAANRQHLLLTARKRAAFLTTAFGQAREKGKGLFLALLDNFGILNEEASHLEVLLHGHAGKNAPALRHVSNAQGYYFVGRDFVYGLALVDDLAFARTVHPADGSQGGAFARPVGPNQGNNLALLNCKGHAFERMDVPVIGVDVFHFKQRHGSSLLPVPRRLCPSRPQSPWDCCEFPPAALRQFCCRTRGPQSDPICS